MRKFTVFLAAVLLITFNLAAQNTLIPFGATWKYLDNGSNQGTAWQAPGFDDASWKSGPAILGYGNTHYDNRKEATVVSYGGDPDNTYITTYIRKALTLTKDYESFTAKLKRDDGAAVYVNGVEVYRSNLPAGPLHYKTVAKYANDNGTDPQTFSIPASAFKQGHNVIAVEIHQVSNSSSDMTFDLELTAKPGKEPHHPPHHGYAHLIPFKSNWKYLDNGSDQGTAWQEKAFDDAGWKWGPAILGYGNPPYNNRGEATKLSFGPDPNNTYITTYFRKTITLDHLFESFKASVKRDDGIVVYVNGVEVFRDHLPKGPINYKTLASYAQDNGMKQLHFDIPASAFVLGKNVVAAEVHQHSKSSSDLTFDLELKGKGAITPPGDQIPPKALSLKRYNPLEEKTTNTSVTFRAIFSESVKGVDAADFELSGSATGTIASVTPLADGTTYDVVVNAITGTGSLGLNLKASGTGITDQAGNPISGGLLGEAYTILAPGDQIPPKALSIKRHNPSGPETTNTSVTFQAIFSEAVTGVSTTSFELSGSAAGTIASVTAVSATTYDVLVNAITGTGSLGLNLKSTGTGIKDLAGNPISGGLLGEVYTIKALNNTPGFVSITPLTALPSRADATRDKQQAKVFFHANKHWAVIAKTGGTYLWVLDGTTWKEVLQLSNRNNRSDAVLDGNLVHILMFGSANAPNQLRTIEYVNNTFQYWGTNPNLVEIPADPGMETVSLAKDGTGRLWIANEGGNEIHVSSSVSPYTTWTAPYAIATNIDEDDIAAAVYIPAQKSIGVLWSNQNIERFGFKTHKDGDPLNVWSSDEVPGGQAADDSDGGGIADDHLNIKVGSDGTLYCAVKTSYDVGHEIGLLVRRPNGTWDQAFYPVAIEGTLPIVVLNESIGRVRVIYTSATYGGDIMYQESATANISFGAPLLLISGPFNNATTSHQNFTSEVVILASDATQVVGVLASDSPAKSTLAGLRTAPTELAAEGAALEQDLKAFPNPFSSKATLSFALPAGGAYSLTLYDSRRMEVVYQSQGQAQAGELTQVEVEGAQLAGGLYFARLQTPEGIKTLRLILDK